jgi:probable HAF family extracellular repeat protein
MTDLGTLAEGGNNGFGINNARQVAGYTTTAPGWVYSAFITGPNGVGMTDLVTLGGSDNNPPAINSGQVVGYSTDCMLSSRVHRRRNNCSWNWDGNRSAHDINEAGEVIGVFTFDDGSKHAYFYSQGSITWPFVATDSSCRRMEGLFSPSAINNNGQIAGHGSLDGVKQQAFMLSYLATPAATVPEPETLLLVGLGTLGLIARRRVMFLA